MTEYTAECAIVSEDTITARQSGSRIELEPSTREGVFLDPAEARTFARGIIALADEIDGGEATVKPAPARTPREDDKVRVVEDDSTNRAGEFVGKVGTLKRIRNDYFRLRYLVEFGDGSGRHGDPVNGRWNVADVELVDEPEPALADWERELLEGSADVPTPVRSPRAKYIDEARALLGDTYFEADSLTRLAEFLAAGE
ncbi:hypothetical protein ABZ446_28645 [Streptomyces sp. NPDC005813]|uniref:hypothetical protein n=1 Tax=Streptomyces sp. NPDC005813 TaxID=3155592 RepID=UPI0033C776BB